MIETYGSALVEAVADYGHSLRFVEPSEHIVVEVDTGDLSGDLGVNFRRFTGFTDRWLEGNEALAAGERRQRATRLILRVKMKAVDAYNRGDIDLEGFRAQVEMMEM